MLFSKLWISGTGRKLVEDYGRDHLLVAINLFTAPQAHMSGLYWCPLPHIAEQVALNVDDVDRIIADLEREGFCRFDRDTQMMWVVAMMRYQVGENPRDTDNRVRSTVRHIKGLPRSILIGEFLDHYQLDLKPPTTHPGGEA